MKKSILCLKGTKALGKNEQIKVLGGLQSIEAASGSCQITVKMSGGATIVSQVSGGNCSQVCADYMNADPMISRCFYKTIR